MFKNILLIIAGFFISFPSTNAQWAQVGDDIYGQTGYESSGTSVSINSVGDIVAIGSPLNGDNGDYTGKLRVYKNINNTWTQIGQGISGETQGENLGTKVSINFDGTIVAASSPTNSGNGNNAGKVRIFKNINDVWTQIGQDLVGAAENYSFGVSISFNSDGTKIAVGAYGADDNGENSGHVRVFENINDTWTQIGQDIEGEMANIFSGFSVSLNDNGTVVAIGAVNHSANGSNSGQVRVFEYVNSSWTQIGSEILGEAENDFLGNDVNLNSDGTVLAVSAYGNDVNGTDSGQVRIYKNINGTWSQIGQNLNGANSNEAFGFSISLNSSGSRIAIGAVGTSVNGSFSGSVQVFEESNGTWNQIDETINGNFENDYLGYSVSLNSSGATFAVGAPFNIGSNNNYPGQIKIYNNSNLGINDSEIINIVAFPNPTSNITTVKVPFNQFTISTLYDVTGKVVYINQSAVKNNQLQIDLSNFENGVYFLNVIQENHSLSLKIIKK